MLGRGEAAWAHVEKASIHTRLCSRLCQPRSLLLQTQTRYIKGKAVSYSAWRLPTCPAEWSTELVSAHNLKVSLFPQGPLCSPPAVISTGHPNHSAIQRQLFNDLIFWMSSGTVNTKVNDTPIRNNAISARNNNISLARPVSLSSFEASASPYQKLNSRVSSLSEAYNLNAFCKALKVLLNLDGAGN